MELIDVNKEDKLIMQHNIITSGRYDFSACMLDILFMVLAGLEKNKLDYIISVQDIELITGRKWNYKQLREATETIGSRMFEIETPKSYVQLWLFSTVEYITGTGTFKISINERAKPYFFELKNNFTSLQLKSVLGCTSKYAKRLYAIACQWRSVGIKRFEIVELKKILGLIDKKGNEQFEQITNLKKFVLDIACKQIAENTDIHLEYELRKQGRSFKWITLLINTQQPKQLEIDFNKTLDVQKFAYKIKAYGLSKEQSKLISENEKEEDFDTLINDLNIKVRQGKLKVNNTIGYIVGIYQKKGIIPIKND